MLMDSHGDLSVEAVVHGAREEVMEEEDEYKA